MRQFTVVAVAGAIALAMSGCASEEASVAPSPAASPAPAASPSPAASPAAAPAAPGAQKFGTPLVAQKPGPTVPGLIQSTNGDERAKQVQTSINTTKATKDPFTGLAPKLPPAVITRTSPPGGNVPVAPRAGGGAGGAGGAGGGTGSGAPSPRVGMRAPNVPARAGSPNRPGGPGVAAAPKPSVPAPPSTTLANGVEVSGIVTVNGVTQAIVKAPNEDTSRYVRVGQRLANGQVLVKRIDAFAGSDPVVILEQNGVEVARVVGDKPIAAAPGEQPKEATPPPPTKPNV
jgi:hypothetical protein